MSMRMAAKQRTICEVLREINDLHQGNSNVDKLTRKKLAECERMAKKMSRRLKAYNKKIYQDWWERNPDYEADFERRVNQVYITG